MQVAKILALTLLGALISADSVGNITLAVYATGLPERILQDIVDTPHEALIEVQQHFLRQLLSGFLHIMCSTFLSDSEAYQLQSKLPVTIFKMQRSKQALLNYSLMGGTCVHSLEELTRNVTRRRVFELGPACRSSWPRQLSY